MDAAQATLKKEKVVVIATSQGKVLLVQRKNDSLELWRFPRISRRPGYVMLQSACACMWFLIGTKPYGRRFALIRPKVDTQTSIIDVFKMELTADEWRQIEQRSTEPEQSSNVRLFELNELDTLTSLKKGDKRLVVALGNPPPSS